MAERTKCSICKTGDLYVDPKTKLFGCQKCDRAFTGSLEDFINHFSKSNSYGELLILVAVIADRPLNHNEMTKLVNWLQGALLTQINKYEQATMDVLSRLRGKG